MKKSAWISVIGSLVLLSSVGCAGGSAGTASEEQKSVGDIKPYRAPASAKLVSCVPFYPDGHVRYVKTSVRKGKGSHEILKLMVSGPVARDREDQAFEILGMIHDPEEKSVEIKFTPIGMEDGPVHEISWTIHDTIQTRNRKKSGRVVADFAAGAGQPPINRSLDPGLCEFENAGNLCKELKELGRSCVTKKEAQAQAKEDRALRAIFFP